MEKKEIEKMIEEKVSQELEEGQDLLQKQTEIAERLFERRMQISPVTADLFLKHLDILLEAGKNFLIVSSTVLVTTLAVDSNTIKNIDIDFLRKISLCAVAISAVSIFVTLLFRWLTTKKLLEDIKTLEKFYQELVNQKFEILNLTTRQMREETGEKVKEILRKKELVKKHAPDL